MGYIKLALVGRPNVGKSALFNRIIKKRSAIVDDEEGTTRDRLYGVSEIFGKPFEVIDTAGIDLHSNKDFNEDVLYQANLAIDEADVIALVVDAKIGVTNLDAEVVKILFKSKKPLVLAVNKVDDASMETHMTSQFYSLGIKKMIPVSAAQGYHIAELLEAAFEGIEFKEIEEEKKEFINVAIVGRANVGKSTLLNYLTSEKRSVVSSIAGTTRDNIDALVENNGQTYSFIDTAGIRRKNKEHEAVDKFASIRTKKAIEKADVCLLILDANEGFTVQEKKIASLIEERGKGCILLLNKWDLIKGYRMEHCKRGLVEESPFIKTSPILFISAKNGRNVDKIFNLVKTVSESQRQRISTGILNKFVEKCLQKCHPPMIGGKRLRIYYLTQVDVAPARFILFVNNSELLTETYKKYLLNQFRDSFSFSGVPIILNVKDKKTKEELEVIQ
jgi:GTPase